MNWGEDLNALLTVFCFGYPFVMAWNWMAGGVVYRWLRERHQPLPDNPPELPDYPMVSILVPCFNEESQAEETFAALAQVEYPEFEIIAINDGSGDRTGEILESLASSIPQMRVVHLSRNQGKANALNVGALLARGEFLVCIDGDALLDRHAVTWLIRAMQHNGRLGAITGNPRIRNRATLLGRMQAGEYSSIIGLIKRAETVLGWIFTVSGVIVCVRKRAAQEAGWWSAATLTEDVHLTWRLQLAGWRVVYEPKALCWILMPETLRGLWRQRLRWAEGGAHTMLISLPKLLSAPFRYWNGWLVFLNCIVSIAWAYVMFLRPLAWLLDSVGVPVPASMPYFRPVPGWWGTALTITYIAQTSVAVALDGRFEKNMWPTLFWIAWYPLLFWILQALTAVVGLPKAIYRVRHPRGTWVSPDRGVR